MEPCDVDSCILVTMNSFLFFSSQILESSAISCPQSVHVAEDHHTTSCVTSRLSQSPDVIRHALFNNINSLAEHTA